MALTSNDEHVSIQGLAQVGPVAVLPSMWGQGIGRQIMQAVMPEIRSRGFTGAQLWTGADNIPARHLYESLGWQLVPGRAELGGAPQVMYRAPAI